jgi:hypothetical protein
LLSIPEREQFTTVAASPSHKLLRWPGGAR